MTVQFGSITFVWGDPQKVAARVQQLADRKGITLSDSYGDRGVVVDQHDARAFLEDRFDVSLPLKPFLLNKKTYDAKPESKAVLNDLWEAMEGDVRFKTLADLGDQVYDWALKRLEDGIDTNRKPVKEENL